MKQLKLTQFGNPILRKKAKPLLATKVKSKEIQNLIADMRHTLVSKKLGVGLAAPQIGQSIALAVVQIRPTPHRPKVKNFDAILINPEITQTFGRRTQLWEGCISSGVGTSGLFARVPRYKKVKVRFMDEKGKLHHKIFEGLPAHVMQHEVDHLNGILFVDRVKDTGSYMTFQEYKKHIRSQRKTASDII